MNTIKILLVSTELLYTLEIDKNNNIVDTIINILDKYKKIYNLIYNDKIVIKRNEKIDDIILLNKSEIICTIIYEYINYLYEENDTLNDIINKLEKLNDQIYYDGIMKLGNYLKYTNYNIDPDGLDIFEGFVFVFSHNNILVNTKYIYSIKNIFENIYYY